MKLNEVDDKAEGLWNKLKRKKWFWIVVAMLAVFIVAAIFMKVSSGPAEADAQVAAANAVAYPSADALVEVENGKTYVKELLFEPATAQFGPVYQGRSASGVRSTCGTVNAVDSQGDRHGFVRFIAGSGGPAEVVFEQPGNGFQALWKTLC